MRIIVTGAAGFMGSFLVEALRGRGDAVEAWIRARRMESRRGVAQERAVDITDSAAVKEAIDRFAPDAVVHLAAQSLPGRSWEEPLQTYRVNVGGGINLLEAARACSPQPRVFLAGSSAEYAEPQDQKPITEQGQILPNSPYGSSKFSVAQLGEMYSRRYGLSIIGFRPFFVIGPRKTGDVCSDFARRIVAIERGAQCAMRVGDLTVERDMIDVRDGIAGVIRLIDHGLPGETYNISAGRAVSIADILYTYCRLAAAPITVAQDPALLRPLEQKVKIGDSSKLRALGWAPRYALNDTLEQILSYWRATEGTVFDAIRVP